MNNFPNRSLASAAGETIEFVRAGSGPDTVVLVNGAGGPIEGWQRVFAPVADFATVIAYNRPGIGRSAPPCRPQTGLHMVATLRAVLQAAGLPPPYVLVGHSLGGLLVNLFARLHPSEVSAAVLLDATAPQDVAVLAQHENALQRGLRAVLDRCSPPDANAEVRHVAASVAQLSAAPPFPGIPLTVVTGGKPAMAWATPAAARAARAAHQRELAALSPLGRQVVAVRSGHFPQFSEPALVVDAIRDATVAAAARRAQDREGMAETP